MLRPAQDPPHPPCTRSPLAPASPRRKEGPQRPPLARATSVRDARSDRTATCSIDQVAGRREGARDAAPAIANGSHEGSREFGPPAPGAPGEASSGRAAATTAPTRRSRIRVTGPVQGEAAYALSPTSSKRRSAAGRPPYIEGAWRPT